MIPTTAAKRSTSKGKAEGNGTIPKKNRRQTASKVDNSAKNKPNGDSGTSQPHKKRNVKNKHGSFQRYAGDFEIPSRTRSAPPPNAAANMTKFDTGLNNGGNGAAVAAAFNPSSSKSPRRRRHASPSRTNSDSSIRGKADGSSNKGFPNPKKGFGHYQQQQSNSNNNNNNRGFHKHGGRPASKSMSVPAHFSSVFGGSSSSYNNNSSSHELGNSMTKTPRKMTMHGFSSSITPQSAPNHTHYAGALFNNSPAPKDLPPPPFLLNKPSSPKPLTRMNRSGPSLDLMAAANGGSTGITAAGNAAPSSGPYVSMAPMSLTEIFKKLKTVESIN
ncbi:hypothetical protein H4219_003286 [Mycoemilia scoparia]|uniref:Uncharacterized protein n=1 Tax=Mycoemilia scoparia TaxID=417184 RepID=A0A9W7ZVD1_9FUNG|nr:hypothetical protein H4219_003286 [Mycoemilia scoparia]